MNTDVFLGEHHSFVSKEEEEAKSQAAEEMLFLMEEGVSALVADKIKAYPKKIGDQGRSSVTDKREI